MFEGRKLTEEDLLNDKGARDYMMKVLDKVEGKENMVHETIVENLILENSKLKVENEMLKDELEKMANQIREAMGILLVAQRDYPQF